MNNYRISKAAILDLEKIWVYTLKNWSADQADQYVSLLIDEIKYLATNFESGKNIDQIKHGFRVSKVKLHLIFYKEADEIIDVVRILHQRMDIKNQLK